jgi:hypothetical protein
MQECITVKRVGVRARGRLERRLGRPVRGEALRYEERLDLNPRLEELRQRFVAGEPVNLADVLAAAGLTPRERHVILERLPRPDGTLRSHGQIAADGVMRKPDGTTYTRQRVEQIERIARRKLGLGRSITAAVHWAERAGRAPHLMASGQAVTPDQTLRSGAGSSTTAAAPGPVGGRARGRGAGIPAVAGVTERSARQYRPPRRGPRRPVRLRVGLRGHVGMGRRPTLSSARTRTRPTTTRRRNRRLPAANARALAAQLPSPWGGVTGANGRIRAAC